MTGNKQPLIETHLIVKGIVQGVFFRARVKKYADELGLTGYVRNLPDKSVEICVAGEAIDALISKLQKEPLPIQIETIEISKTPLARNYQGFEVLT